jgi:hypothetical protein
MHRVALPTFRSVAKVVAVVAVVAAILTVSCQVTLMSKLLQV